MVDQRAIFLAGGGNTAHVFDLFAPKLTTHGHVYGITRRGFGASGFSASERPVDRLRDDLLAVMDALEVDRPVLVGHSIAGSELSSVANSYPDRVAGLVYLEAACPYAFDNGKGPTMEEFQRLRGPRPPTRADCDLPSFRSLQKRDAEMHGFRIPEGVPPHLGVDFRRTTREGARVPGRCPRSRSLRSPTFRRTRSTRAQIPRCGRPPGAYFTAVDALAERQAKGFEGGVPAARVVRLQGAHYIFLSHERDEMREMGAFLASLKPSGATRD